MVVRPGISATAGPQPPRQIATGLPRPRSEQQAQTAQGLVYRWRRLPQTTLNHAVSPSTSRWAAWPPTFTPKKTPPCGSSSRDASPPLALQACGTDGRAWRSVLRPMQLAPPLLTTKARRGPRRSPWRLSIGGACTSGRAVCHSSASWSSQCIARTTTILSTDRLSSGTYTRPTCSVVQCAVHRLCNHREGDDDAPHRAR